MPIVTLSDLNKHKSSSQKQSSDHKLFSKPNPSEKRVYWAGIDWKSITPENKRGLARGIVLIMLAHGSIKHFPNVAPYIGLIGMAITVVEGIQMLATIINNGIKENDAKPDHRSRP
jgi:hypothetical protein